MPSVEGGMTRKVETIGPSEPLVVARRMRDLPDWALMLDAMAGFDMRDPRSFDAPAVPFSRALDPPPRWRRVAFSADLGGITPVDPEVATVCGKAAACVTDAWYSSGLEGLPLPLIVRNEHILRQAIACLEVIREEPVILPTHYVLECSE